MKKVSSYEISKVVMLHEKDNIVVTTCDVKAGDEINIQGIALIIKEDVALGHKVAIKDIHVGEQVIKYGASIGSAFKSIINGEHVHINNMKSDYIASHLRDVVE